MRDHILLTINGERRELGAAQAFLTLSDLLRETLGLRGTKIVCSEGDCGACTVLVGRVETEGLHYRVVDACITFVFQLDLCHVVTVEGLADDAALHVVQQRLVDGYGSQCGFCTPGFVTTCVGALENSDSPLQPEDLRLALSGNLCRCTGYLQILESICAIDPRTVEPLAARFDSADLLEAHATLGLDEILLQDGERRIFLPSTLDSALDWKARSPESRVVAGATDLAVQHNKGHLALEEVLYLGPRIEVLGGVRIDENVLTAGSGATWSEILAAVRKPLPELAAVLERFGAEQIRNHATVGGNLANASPIADSLPFFYAVGAEVELRSVRGSRRVPVEAFYRGYKQLDLEPDELIVAIESPLPTRNEELRLYKISRRHDLDISTFTAAILVRHEEERIDRARVAYGGVAETVVRLRQTEALLEGGAFDLETFARAAVEAQTEIDPITDVRGDRSYRLRLAHNILLRFFHDVDRPMTNRDRNSSSLSVRDTTTRCADPPHDSAHLHVTGTAPYVEDLPRRSRELVVDFVPSSVANGRLLSIATEEALRLEGVVGIYTHRDLETQHLFGPVIEDEPFLPRDRVSYIGQPVAVIACENREAARQARRLVRVEIDEEPPVLSIEEADRRSSFIGPERSIARGDLVAGRQAASRSIRGVFECNGQEQFYLESQAALAWLGVDAEMRIHSSTQNPTEIQKVVAEVLGRRHHEVVCEVKCMGGAFGGKETQAALPALMAALVVDRTGRPARVVYTKDDDMVSTGKRHPYRVEYRVDFDDDGLVCALEIELRSNGGAFADLSTGILERSMLHVDNAYYLPNVAISARICRTNLPPNTAFRGFGGPQAMAAIENIMQEIAIDTGRDALDVRRLNAYPANLKSTGQPATNRSLTPYGQEVSDNLLPEILDRLETTSQYRDRLGAIEALAAGDPTRLRGLAMTPVKFGISFTTKFLNQANALVNLYTDGSLQVSTGATEMGQGVHTKIAQLVAKELGLEAADVRVMTTSTEKNHNTSPTAASAGTDLNGAAALQATRTIRDRLARFAAARLSADTRDLDSSAENIRFEGGEVFDARRTSARIPFAELADAARKQRIDLGARGFYATPGIDFDRDAGRGEPFYYFTTGAAVAEVEIDRFTGELRIERIDALLDVGRRINEGIERGQTIGGLIQGVGWVTTEELVYGSRGELLSSSPTTYKIPNITDLPPIFNVDFLDNDLNSQNLRGVKATGEPPLMLAISVWAAIKHALSFLEPGELPPLRLPATHEEILRSITALETHKQQMPNRVG